MGLLRPILDHVVEAPLKLAAPRPTSPLMGSHPRPRGRGPVEAIFFGPLWMMLYIHPRPRGRGPVEASISSTHSLLWPTILDHVVEAPLKLHLLLLLQLDLLPSSTTWSRPR